VEDADVNDAISNSILGCLVGGAIGDAAGAAVEAGIADGFSFDGWRLTDDTQLTLATCEAIVESGAVDPESIAVNFLRWYRQRRLNCLGASTFKALHDLEAGNHWALAGRGGERAAGNGAAMRIAPLAFLLDPFNDEERRAIRDVCRITHHNDEAYVGALAILLAIQQSRLGSLSLTELATRLPDTLVRDRIQEVARLPLEMDVVEVAKKFGASGFVVESVPLSLFAATRGGVIGFDEMVREIVAARGDADTNASMACQIAGTRVGLDGLPSELVERLPEREMALEIARRFAQHVVGRSPSG
jgi:ADP-ribosyl-[dinitrogen reductase] hydrolase